MLYGVEHNNQPVATFESSEEAQSYINNNIFDRCFPEDTEWVTSYRKNYNIVELPL